jgi:hypothetical protein
MYALYANGSRHLYYKCPKTRQTFLVQYVAGLKIPEIKSKKLLKIENRTPNLL